ncbi:hypothetical protein QE152_g13426 [Popillia japonica]|uniref:Transposase n=1 Tax=Popillia japonica TaxID=7064 RepID=A0AAW1LC68_POPJA
MFTKGNLQQNNACEEKTYQKSTGGMTRLLSYEEFVSESEGYIAERTKEVLQRFATPYGTTTKKHRNHSGTVSKLRSDYVGRRSVQISIEMGGWI